MLGAADKLSHNPAPEGGRKGRIQPRGRDSAYCEPFPGFGETPNLTPWTKAIIPRRFGGSPGHQPGKRWWRVRSVVRLGVLFAPNLPRDVARGIGCQIGGPLGCSRPLSAPARCLLQPMVCSNRSIARAGGCRSRLQRASRCGPHRASLYGLNRARSPGPNQATQFVLLRANHRFGIGARLGPISDAFRGRELRQSPHNFGSVTPRWSWYLPFLSA
jgi:hypothetical protein